MKPPGFGDEGQGRVQFKDNNHATAFVFKEKEKSLLSLGPPVTVRWEMVLGTPCGQAHSSPWAWFSFTTATEPTFLILTIHSQALCQLSSTSRRKFWTFWHFLRQRWEVERDWRLLCGTRTIHDLPTRLIAPITLFFSSPEWSILYSKLLQNTYFPEILRVSLIF